MEAAGSATEENAQCKLKPPVNKPRSPYAFQRSQASMSQSLEVLDMRNKITTQKEGLPEEGEWQGQPAEQIRFLPLDYSWRVKRTSKSCARLGKSPGSRERQGYNIALHSAKIRESINPRAQSSGSGVFILEPWILWIFLINPDTKLSMCGVEKGAGQRYTLATRSRVFWMSINALS